VGRDHRDGHSPGLFPRPPPDVVAGIHRRERIEARVRRKWGTSPYRDSERLTGCSRDARFGRRLEDQPSCEQTPASPNEPREARRPLADLRWRRRRVLELKLAGFGYREIMERLGVTYTNVNRDLTEARAELRRAA
jgi:DNA-directed RNA polymerase specialized sigma24 family protein